VKVGSAMTTLTPGSTTVASRAWISSLDPFPTRIPSVDHPVASEIAEMKSVATKGGYRFQGRDAKRSHSADFNSAGTSKGDSFWLSLIGGSKCLSVYAFS